MIYIVVIVTQLLFSASDLLGRHYMSQQGFRFATFISWWFLAYQLIRFVATIGQLYVFTNLELGKTMTLFAASSLILINVAGYFLLGEVLTAKTYTAIVLVVLAFMLVAASK